MKSNPTQTSFKRLLVGAVFSTNNGLTFRKTSERGAFRLLVEDKLRPGRGQVHAEVPFARSTAVALT